MYVTQLCYELNPCESDQLAEMIFFSRYTKQAQRSKELKFFTPPCTCATSECSRDTNLGVDEPSFKAISSIVSQNFFSNLILVE